jgi:hypothetical protein
MMIQFINDEGEIRSFDGSTTIEQIMEMGATVSLVKPREPIPPHTWVAIPEPKKPLNSSERYKARKKLIKNNLPIPEDLAIRDKARKPVSASKVDMEKVKTALRRLES